ncbi:hypothetical protein FA13DRAFT_1634612 [Coprinellus micaceus]|uniref:intramembrane prenyl-peptidase Rce1 n=1 Tax=Coprinellus micaceus TaxID=71717 RepID=A0A4Y7T0I0_COPMI|nr:hypothetical protein FA13DRAFT_1634612 [Coprinellus micaceus]
MTVTANDLVGTLSGTTAHGLALGFAFIFVGSLYVSNHTRLSFDHNVKVSVGGYQRIKQNNERWRDDPDVIRARLAAVSIASVICCAIVGYLLSDLTHSKSSGEVFKLAAKHLGFASAGPILSHLVTPVLFLGPLYAMFLGGDLPFQQHWDCEREGAKFTSWIGIRSYIFAPFTEELVFRACVCTVYHISGTSTSRMIFLTPFTFGVAHAHHAWDTYNRYGRNTEALKRAILGTIFQLMYTTLFGFLATYIFLRTGSLLPAWTAHAFCNVMGFPNIGWELQAYPHRRKQIIAVYLAGVVGFAFVLSRWTFTPDSIFWFPSP